MDAHRTHSNLLSASGESSCNEASGSLVRQERHESSNTNKSYFCEGSGGPIAGAEKPHSSQTQADPLEISVSSQLSVPGEPRRTLRNSPKSSDANLSISDFPDELLLAVLSYMSISELLDVIPRVCSRWETLSRNAMLWHGKVYEIRDGRSDEEILRTLEMIPHLRTLAVRRRVSPSVLQALCANCPDLTTLDILEAFQREFSNSEVKNLVNIWTKIRTLKIPFRLVNEILVDGALKLSHLRVLQLNGIFRDRPNIILRLSTLADKCPQLCSLDMKYMDYKIPDMEYFLNAKKHTLKRICVKWTSTSGSPVAPLLAGCASTLEHLVLYDCHTQAAGGTEKAYGALGKLHNLQVLSFLAVRGDSSGALPLVFKSGGLSNLKTLQFSDCWCVMDDTIISVSRGCPALRELSLDYCDKLTDAAFVDIHHLKQLEMLVLHHCQPLGGDTIPCIASLPALHTLHLGVWLKGLQPGLDHILDMPGLRCLFFRDICTLLVPFDRFPDHLVKLRVLSVECCFFDKDILDEMCKRMPYLKVYRPCPDSDSSDYENDDASDE